MSLCTELCSSRVTKLVLVVSGTTHQLLRYEGVAIYGHFCYLWLQYVNTSYWHDKYVLPILGLHNHKSSQAIQYWYTWLVLSQTTLEKRGSGDIQLIPWASVKFMVHCMHSSQLIYAVSSCWSRPCLMALQPQFVFSTMWLVAAWSFLVKSNQLNEAWGFSWMSLDILLGKRLARVSKYHCSTHVHSRLELVLQLVC